MVVDSKRSFATSNWTFYSPDFFFFGWHGHIDAWQANGERYHSQQITWQIW